MDTVRAVGSRLNQRKLPPTSQKKIKTTQFERYKTNMWIDDVAQRVITERVALKKKRGFSMHITRLREEGRNPLHKIARASTFHAQGTVTEVSRDPDMRRNVSIAYSLAPQPKAREKKLGP